MTTRFSSKDPGEIVRVGFNFKAPCANPAVAISVRDGEDANPNAMLSGSPVVTGDWVYQLVTGGLHGVDYEIDCYADVGSERLLIDTILPVRERPAD